MHAIFARPATRCTGCTGSGGLSLSQGVPVFLDSLQLDRLASTKLYSRDEEGIIAFLSSNFSRRKISVTIEKATTLYTREKHTVAQCRSAFRRVRRWNRTVIRMIYTRLERGVLPRGGIRSLFPLPFFEAQVSPRSVLEAFVSRGGGYPPFGGCTHIFSRRNNKNLEFIPRGIKIRDNFCCWRGEDSRNRWKSV